MTRTNFRRSLNPVSRDAAQALRDYGISPSAQRVAVASYVLNTEDHPSADEVWTRVRETFPHVSRATVYNTLKLLVTKGLLRQHAITEGRVIFDPNVAPHHHLIDEDTGRVHDVPWESVALPKPPRVRGFEVSEYQVVMRGRKKR